ncbi:SMC-Scp complex subunit ScpB [Taibaiella chishuiensis]|uniref:Segregation and condensation protein B n=1 Tax=Taibaiella chishuiensis TaxID=1434707 RepID=A0A2P8DC51_9BACT|nr:SMC-Scp complex subunit ScpB [Taibaiella chishuiensis]PSK94794.1 segregation and condensation protein B [Taibaiella chishuiensis]
MEIEQLMPHVEALIFASERPLPQMEMIELLGNVMDAPLESDKVAICLEAVKEKYDTEYYPFELSETGGGYQFLTKKTYHQTVLQLNGDKYIKKLSTSAMETLAIIVYKQPITKSDIEFIRGVSSDYSIQKLLEKELIMIAGRNEQAVGKPLLYATTKNFMDYLGINATGQLPELKEIINTDIVFPTNGAEAIPDSDVERAESGQLFIDSSGELREGERNGDAGDTGKTDGEDTDNTDTDNTDNTEEV